MSVRKVGDAVARIKWGKAAVTDRFKIEILGTGWDIVLLLLVHLLNIWMKVEKIPKDWHRARIIFFFIKKKIKMKEQEL